MGFFAWRASAPDDPAGYAAAVERQLRDVRRDQRRALVDDLRQHLREYPVGEDLAERLGTPAAYAAELRRSAGLPPPRVRGWVRWLPLWVRIAVPLLVVLVVGAVFVARSPDVASPLTAGSSWFMPGTKASPEFGDRTNVLAHYQEGQEYQFAVKLRNTGHFTVTVDSVEFPHLLFWFLQVVQVRLGRAGEAGLTRSVEDFHSFKLDPGEERAVFFHAVFAFCEDSSGGATQTVDGLTVHFHVLGLGEAQEVPMNQPLGVIDPGQGTPQCPVPRAESDGTSAGADDALVAFPLVDRLGFEVTVVSDVATPAAAGDSPPGAPCAGMPPSGVRALAFYLNVSEGSLNESAGDSVDLRLTLRGSERPLLLETGAGTACRPATPFRIVAGTMDEPTIIRGVAFVASTPCPVQEIHVEARRADGSYEDAGNLRLYVPCS